jgi:hypothetical protein
LQGPQVKGRGASPRILSQALLSFWMTVSPLGQPAIAAQAAVLQASVAPQADEDLASDCRYEMLLPDRTQTVRAVWVVFDRGRDMLRYYDAADVQAFAHRHGLALLLAFHCRARSGADGDMNMDPRRESGALFSQRLLDLPRLPSIPSWRQPK